MSEITLSDLSLAAHKKILLDSEVSSLQCLIESKQKKIKIIEEETIPEAMRELGIQKFQLDTGQKVELKETVYSAMTNDDKPVAFTWLANNNYGGLIKVNIQIEFTRNQRQKAIRLYKILTSKIDSVDDLRNALGDDKVELIDIIKEVFGVEYAAKIKEDVHHQTMASFLKERLKKDDADFPMEEIFKARPLTKAVIK